MSEAERALRQLEGDGLLQRAGDVLRTTRRFQSAMARAALELQALGDEGSDLRTPIALALVFLYGADLNDQQLAACVEALLPVERRELGLDRQPVAEPNL